MTLCQYSQLKQQIVMIVSSSNKPKQLLFDIKDHYKDGINSHRRYEQIETIGQLLTVLEIRNILSKNDVGPLKEIALRVSHTQTLISKIDEFQHINATTVNYYKDDSEKEEKFTEQPRKDFTNKNIQNNISLSKKERIYKTVVEDLGSEWRDVARNLKITETKIKEIDRGCETLDSKASKLLEIYEETNPQWISTLCESLEAARRKDLARQVRAIVAMNL